MSTIEGAETAVAVEAGTAVRKGRAPRPLLRGTWWRHLIAIVAIVFAIFPVAYMASAAFSADGTLTGATLIPRDVTLDNFRTILSGSVTVGGDVSDIPYPRWYFNSVVIALVTALLTVMLSALAAYAFSRFRFRGRRLGMLTLLLIQMFPQLLLVVAIYLIVLNTGEVFSFLGLNAYTALIVVYLGGAMGVNTWLMKGFFDTIPKELDEAATIDGASHAQIFFGMILPLAAPIIAISGILAFVGTMNDFILASLFLTDRPEMTLAVGLKTLTADNSPASYFGIFAAGTLLTSVLTVAVFMSLQRYIVSGLTGGAVKG
jgi:arabinogalactan oligomer/maltooligosaccharide transport system permease protein